MFQAALLAFKNKKDQDLENGVLHREDANNTATRINDSNEMFGDDGSSRNTKSDAGWTLVRNTVVPQVNQNKAGNNTYLQNRISRLRKLSQDVPVVHKETKLHYEYKMDLPDYTQNALPTKFAIESQMKSHKAIVENARKGTNTQPPPALHWMLKKSKERLQDKLPGFNVCKTIKHHNTRDQLVVLKRRHHMHDKRIHRAKKCVTSYHTDTHIVAHLKRSRRAKRKMRKRLKKYKKLRDHVDGIDHSTRKKLTRPSTQEVRQYIEKRGKSAGQLLLPAMEAKLYHSSTTGDIAKHIFPESKRSHNIVRGKSSNGSIVSSVSMPSIVNPRFTQPNIHDKRISDYSMEKDTAVSERLPNSTTSPFITRNEYIKMSSNAKKNRTQKKKKRRKKSPKNLNKISKSKRRSPTTSDLMKMMKHSKSSPDSGDQNGVRSLLNQFNSLTLEKKKEYLHLMKKEMLLDISEKETPDISNSAVSRSASIIV